MNPTYRVEAFIVPKNCVNLSEDVNTIDDVKVAKQNPPRNDQVSENDEIFNDFMSKIQMSALRSDCDRIERQYCNESALRKRFETAEYVSIYKNARRKSTQMNPLIKTSSLMSIDERGETPDTGDDYCCHGHKNGCTTAIQRPEAVTEEVFEINLMKRLEQLRVREAAIKHKEQMLYERERLLFQKEKELRIVERLVKDKLKHAELQLKRCSKVSSRDFTDCDAESKISEQSRETSSSDPSRGAITDEKLIRNPPNSRSSLTAENFSIKSSTLPAYSSYASSKAKRRPKLNYDDMNSTLSADVGDSSYIVTSKKFDPEVFKRPLAFTRTSSERRPSRVQPEQVIKRASENIQVAQDKTTKFQDYGLIDPEPSEKNSLDNRRYSYLDLEDGKNKMDTVTTRLRKMHFSKDRPVSWNENTNEWLQKKRQAYNNLHTAQQVSVSDLNNKENQQDINLKLTQVQKKNTKVKKFSIFR